MYARIRLLNDRSRCSGDEVGEDNAVAGSLQTLVTRRERPSECLRRRGGWDIYVYRRRTSEDIPGRHVRWTRYGRRSKAKESCCCDRSYALKPGHDGGTIGPWRRPSRSGGASFCTYPAESHVIAFHPNGILSLYSVAGLKDQYFDLKINAIFNNPK